MKKKYLHLDLKEMAQEKIWCKMVNCLKSEAQAACPTTCSAKVDPSWCKMADCSNAEASQACKQTCPDKTGNIVISGKRMLIL